MGAQMTNPTVQEIAANSEVASLPTSASSPTSTRSSTSTSQHRINSTSSSPLKSSNNSYNSCNIASTDCDSNHRATPSQIIRSSSFNDSCTVPVKITAQTPLQQQPQQSKIKNSPSFTGCSLKAKIACARSSLDRKLMGGREAAQQNKTKSSSTSTFAITSSSQAGIAVSTTTVAGTTTTTVATLSTINNEQNLVCLSIVKSNDNQCVDYYV